jgi:hypothetical protein
MRTERRHTPDSLLENKKEPGSGMDALVNEKRDQ